MSFSRSTIRGKVVRLLWAFVLLSSDAYAQRPPDMKLNAGINRQVVEGAIRAINKYYVSAEVAKKTEENLRQRLNNSEYDKITSAFDLIDALDAHMQGISKDRHLALAYSHRPEPLLEGRDSRFRPLGP